MRSVEVQPLLLHVQRLREALDYLGQPLRKETSELLDRAAKAQDALLRVASHSVLITVSTSGCCHAA